MIHFSSQVLLLLLIVSLIVLGGLVLLLGSLVLLVVCSGINDLCDDAPKPSTDEASRSECQWQRIPPNTDVSLSEANGCM